MAPRRVRVKTTRAGAPRPGVRRLDLRRERGRHDHVVAHGLHRGPGVDLVAPGVAQVGAHEPVDVAVEGGADSSSRWPPPGSLRAAGRRRGRSPGRTGGRPRRARSPRCRRSSGPAGRSGPAAGPGCPRRCRSPGAAPPPARRTGCRRRSWPAAASGPGRRAAAPRSTWAASSRVGTTTSARGRCIRLCCRPGAPRAGCRRPASCPSRCGREPARRRRRARPGRPRPAPGVGTSIAGEPRGRRRRRPRGAGREPRRTGRGRARRTLARGCGRRASRPVTRLPRMSDADRRPGPAGPPHRRVGAAPPPTSWRLLRSLEPGDWARPDATCPAGTCARWPPTWRTWSPSSPGTRSSRWRCPTRPTSAASWASSPRPGRSRAPGGRPSEIVDELREQRRGTSGRAARRPADGRRRPRPGLRRRHRVDLADPAVEPTAGRVGPRAGRPPGGRAGPAGSTARRRPTWSGSSPGRCRSCWGRRPAPSPVRACGCVVSGEQPLDEAAVGRRGRPRRALRRRTGGADGDPRDGHRDFVVAAARAGATRGPRRRRQRRRGPRRRGSWPGSPPLPDPAPAGRPRDVSRTRASSRAYPRVVSWGQSGTAATSLP